MSFLYFYYLYGFFMNYVIFYDNILRNIFIVYYVIFLYVYYVIFYDKKLISGIYIATITSHRSFYKSSRHITISLKSTDSENRFLDYFQSCDFRKKKKNLDFTPFYLNF